MLAVPWVMSKEERFLFLDTMVNLKLALGYASGFKKHIIKGKLRAMKSHDYHVLLQSIFPLCMWYIMTKEPWMVIMRIYRIFKLICNKVYDPTTYQELKSATIYSLCLLEKTFSPSFFNLMIHLVVHLIDELDLCGPLHSCWIYLIEWAMKDLKNYFKNVAKPESRAWQKAIFLWGPRVVHWIHARI